MRLIACSILLCLCGAAPALPGDVAEAPRTPVLIELFTSQGCSSCPEAEFYLAKLLREQPLKHVRIIAVSEHVDYWDTANWKDPFSSEECTRRQRRYARRFETEVYTPQLVVDGREHYVGSRRTEVLSSIYRAGRREKAELDLVAAWSETGSIMLSVAVGNVPEGAGDLELWTVVTEDDLTVEVKAGENRGRELHHEAVARHLGDAGKIQAHQEREVEIPVSEDWDRPNLRVVAWVQDSRSGRVIGVESATPRSEAGP